MPKEAKSPSPMNLVLTLVVMGFLLWSLFGASEPPSPTLKALMWVLLLANVIYLGVMVFRPKR